MRLYKEGISDFEPWSGAVETWENLQKYDRVDMLEDVLDEVYPEGLSVTGLNDILWFDQEAVYDWVGLYYNGDTGEVSEVPFDDEEDGEYGEYKEVTNAWIADI